MAFTIQQLIKNSKFSKKRLAIVVSVITLVGIYLIWSGHALPPCSGGSKGDLNCDNKVSVLDLSVLLTNYGSTNTAYDATGDGKVDLSDLSVILTNYNTTIAVTPTPPPVLSITSLGQPGNWATTPIPSNIATQTGNAPSGLPLASEFQRELAGQAAANSYVNTAAYTPKFYHVPADTPMQPVRLCRSTGGCVPNWGGATDDLWRAALGVSPSSTPDRVTGKPSGTTAVYWGGGIPLTDAVIPAPGTDKEAVVCLGGGNAGPWWTAKNADGSVFVRPDGQKMEGYCWEVWGLGPDPTYDPNMPISITNTKFMISWGARRTGFIRYNTTTPVNTTYPLDTLSGAYWRQTNYTWYGIGASAAGHPQSTVYWQGWGVTAAELPMLVDVVSDDDCKAVIAGATDWGHAIGIELQYTRYPSGYRWWPAYASDGRSPTLATVEGMRGYFPASVAMPAGLNAWGRAEFLTIQKYGFAIDDQVNGGPALQTNTDGSYKSGGALMQRSERGSANCSTLGVSGSQLRLMPWGQAVLIKQGGDSNPNPTQ